MKFTLKEIVIIGLVFVLGIVIGITIPSFYTDTPASIPNHPEQLRINEIIFADEDKRDFIEHAQFKLSPTGEFIGLENLDTTLMLMHDQEDDWFYYYGAFIEDEELIEEYAVPYEDHRELEGGPDDTIFLIE